MLWKYSEVIDMSPPQRRNGAEKMVRARHQRLCPAQGGPGTVRAEGSEMGEVARARVKGHSSAEQVGLQQDFNRLT